MNNDHKATFLGVLLAAVQAANLDYSKLFHGDILEAGKAVAVVATVAFGYFTNKDTGTKIQLNMDHAVVKKVVDDALAKAATGGTAALVCLLSLLASATVARAQVAIRYTPEPMAVPASVLANAKDMGRWKIEACLADNAPAPRSIAMEKVSMASGPIAFIDPDDAMLVLTGNVQRSTYAKIMKGVSIAGGVVAVGLSIASRSNATWAAGVGIGSALFPDVVKIISGNTTMPTFIPLLSTVKWPVTLVPGGCLTDHWFAGKMKSPKPVNSVIP